VRQEERGWRRRDGLTRIIALANQKGGVGKTTTAVNLGAALAELGQRVLLIDMDPQASLTRYLAVDPNGSHKTIAHLIGERDTPLAAVLQRTASGVDIVPSNEDLAGVVMDLRRSLGTWQRALQRKLLPDAAGYDYVLIDPPPEAGELLMLTLVASTEVFVVMQCEMDSYEKMTTLLAIIDLAREELAPGLRLSGIVPTMYVMRARHCREIVAALHAHYDGLVFQTVINRSIRLADAFAAHQPVTQFDTRSDAAKAYRSLAREVLNGR